MSLDIYNLLEKISFTRVSGSSEEFKCANILKETVENLGGNANIWPFNVSGYKINTATLSANGKKYEVSGIKGSGNAVITAPLYYMETNLDTDKYEINGKIVLINGVINVPTYKKLLKYGAVGFISYSGDITDTDSDLEKGYIEVENRKGVIEKFPLTSLSIGAVIAEKGRFANILEIGEVSAQVKHMAKSIMGSSYAIDRRQV